ncbi:MAG: hypothetical protein RLZZ111_1426 [Planctomycetota bacterium]
MTRPVVRALVLCLLLHAPAARADEQRAAFFARHCQACHSGPHAEAGLDITALPRDFSDPGALRTFVRIRDRIARGEMPPAGEDRPAATEVAAITTRLDAALHDADARRIARTGRARMRRLTRTEFENTLQDLLALPRLEIQEMLPGDGRVAGYDKIAEALDISPAHLKAYREAVEQALDAAIATRSAPPPVFRRRIHPAGLFKFGGSLVEGNFVLLKDGQADPALPVRGGFADVEWHIDAAGSDADLPERRRIFQEQKIKESKSSVGLLVPNFPGYEAAMNVAPIYPGTYRIAASIWGFRWEKGQVTPVAASQAAVFRAHAEGRQQEGGRLLATMTAASLAPRVHEFTTWLDANESIVFDPVSIPWRGLQIRQIGGRTAKHVGPGVALDWFEIEGPINPVWPPESHRRLFGDLPIRELPADAAVVPPTRRPPRQTPLYLPAFASLSARDQRPPLETVQAAAPLEDARRLLAAFMPRAFRRDIEPAEVEPYVTLVADRLAARDCFEDAMRRAYVAMLTSPEFLFHEGDGPADAPAAPFRLAARLSYWLWNSPPDAPLLAAARAGTLLDRGTLHAEVERLLADPRSERFVEDFADQWLELRRIDETSPDRRLYPEYSFLLHEGMVAETRGFLRAMIDGNRPVASFIDPDFTTLTQRLAEHYGIPDVDGVEVRQVALPPASPRGGFLAQAAIHKLTANGTVTSPVKRGVWIMDRLLDDPPPPPPPGVAGVDPDTRGTTTIREQLARHRADTSCATCHAHIDPPGFALEAFDPVGGFRDRYRSTGAGDAPPRRADSLWFAHYRLGPPVDASGSLHDGRAFADVRALKQLVAADDRRLARAFVGHLARYATGADLSYADRRAIDDIVTSTQSSGYGARALIHALAESPLLLGAAGGGGAATASPR